MATVVDDSTPASSVGNEDGEAGANTAPVATVLGSVASAAAAVPGKALSTIWNLVSGSAKGQADGGENTPSRQTDDSLDRPPSPPLVISTSSGLAAKPRVRTVHALGDNDWIAAIQLSVWDNVFGPKVEKVWHGQHRLPDDLPTFIARTTLIDRNPAAREPVSATPPSPTVVRRAPSPAPPRRTEPPARPVSSSSSDSAPSLFVKMPTPSPPLDAIVLDADSSPPLPAEPPTTATDASPVTSRRTSSHLSVSSKTPAAPASASSQAAGKSRDADSRAAAGESQQQQQQQTHRLQSSRPWNQNVKFYHYPSLGDEGVVIFVVTFDARYVRYARAGATSKAAAAAVPFSLVLVIRPCDLQRCLVFLDTAKQRLFCLMMKLRHLLKQQPVGAAIESFSPLVVRFAEALNPLYYAGLPSSPRFRSSLWFSLSAKYAPFLLRALSSHLHARGSTVVIGGDKHAVNAMVDTLALFLTHSERMRSSYVVDGRSFVPDLILQGVVTDRVAADELIHSSLPTTVINIDTLLIEQTQQLDDPPGKLTDYDVVEVKSTTSASQSASSSSSSSSSSPSSSSSSSISASSSSSSSSSSLASSSLASLSSSLVSSLASSSLEMTVPSASRPPYATPLIRLMHEVLLLPPPLREGYVRHSYLSLIHSAISLIKYTEHISRADHRSPDLEAIRSMRKHLKLKHEPDFFLVVCLAEKRMPGIYNHLAADLQLIENKFVELFESGI